MKTKRIVIVTAIAVSAMSLFSSCKKDTGIQCWQCYDNLGNQLSRYCGATIEDAHRNSGTINGGTSLDNFRQWCQKEN